jgi:hypothetical protein
VLVTVTKAAKSGRKDDKKSDFPPLILPDTPPFREILASSQERNSFRFSKKDVGQ